MTDGVPNGPDGPPLDPPSGCADPLLWRVARALHEAHRPRPDNFCECKAFWPCPDARLAEEALRMAYGRPAPRINRTALGRNANLGRWPA
ncbi:hypothetical protein Drose_07700 [Dactylosporangium roseum]|uniref:Uncharacterized protein n=1 Tax=Dactylosporangium roseum TaxID=47989 RepID=A0ABY5ZAV4_9ACTN|nr:hypothetical protein [Dactylosporangium roseum]UWZ38130.1 hypothetical protein Drose_07700 [Dactylosporangium roseum]